METETLFGVCLGRSHVDWRAWGGHIRATPAKRVPVLFANRGSIN